MLIQLWQRCKKQTAVVLQEETSPIQSAADFSSTRKKRRDDHQSMATQTRDEVERRLVALEEQWQKQDDRLQKQDDRLQKQDDRLQKQDDRLQKQDDRLQKQDDRLQKQDDRIQKQNDRLQKQDDRLQKQDDRLQKQDERIDALDARLTSVEFMLNIREMARIVETILLGLVNDQLQAHKLAKFRTLGDFVLAYEHDAHVSKTINDASRRWLRGIPSLHLFLRRCKHGANVFVHGECPTSVASAIQALATKATEETQIDDADRTQFIAWLKQQTRNIDAEIRKKRVEFEELSQKLGFETEATP